MKPSFLVCLLLLSSFLCEAQGVRLSLASLSAEHLRIIQEKTEIKKTDNGAGLAILCKGGHCSGMHRKLVTKTTFKPKTTTRGKNDENDGNKDDLVTLSGERLGGKEENLSSEHREEAQEPYPDILDLAGMDYSPVRRKPPIHN